MSKHLLGPLSNTKLSFLDESQVVLKQMLLGWANQQEARRLETSTIKNRASIIERFVRHTDAYPWQWTSSDYEQFIASLVHGAGGLAFSTTMSYSDAIRSFCHYLASPSYPWIEECQRRFASAPAQIVNEWNARSHKSAYDGLPGRRMFSRAELQTLFDTADARVSSRRGSGRKGQHVTLRDSQLLKTTYAFGLRRREAVMMDVVDLRTNPYWPEMGRYAALFVRFGKSSNGGPPKRRAVLGIPQLEAASRGLKQWVEHGRATFDIHDEGAIWLSERKARLSSRGFEARFQGIREEAGLPEELTLHCLRHTYITHAQEMGYSERFVMEQVGHAYASTTAGYTAIGDDYRNAAVLSAIGKMATLDTATSAGDETLPDSKTA